MKKKKLFTYTEPGPTTSVQKLPLLSQFMLLVRGFSDDNNNTEVALEEAQLELRATFTQFLEKALKPIRAGKAQSVTISLSSEFDTVLQDVLDSPYYADYYRYTIQRPDTVMNIRHFMLLTMEVIP